MAGCDAAAAAAASLIIPTFGAEVASAVSAKRSTLTQNWANLICVPSLRVGLFYFWVRLFYLHLVFVAYGQLAWSFLLTVWSFLLTVEIWFGLFYLRSPPLQKFGHFCLRFPPSGNWVWSFLLTVPPP